MNKNRKLKRTNINITEDEHSSLIREMDATGLSMSDIVRRALDKYFDGKKNENK